MRSKVGRFWRLRIRQAGSCLRLSTTRQASATSLASAGRRTISPGMLRNASQLLDRLMGRAVLADPDRVVRKDVDDRESP